MESKKQNKQNKIKQAHCKQIPKGWLPEGKGDREIGGKGEGKYTNNSLHGDTITRLSGMFTL